MRNHTSASMITRQLTETIDGLDLHIEIVDTKPDWCWLRFEVPVPMRLSRPLRNILVITTSVSARLLSRPFCRHDDLKDGVSVRVTSTSNALLPYLDRIAIFQQVVTHPVRRLGGFVRIVSDAMEDPTRRRIAWTAPEIACLRRALDILIDECLFEAAILTALLYQNAAIAHADLRGQLPIDELRATIETQLANLRHASRSRYRTFRQWLGYIVGEQNEIEVYLAAGSKALAMLNRSEEQDRSAKSLDLRGQ